MLVGVQAADVPGQRQHRLVVAEAVRCRAGGSAAVAGVVPASSSREIPYSFAGCSTTSRVGLRWPVSIRDSGLGEIPVAPLTSAGVTPRRSRRARSRSPIAASVWATSSPAAVPVFLPAVPLHLPVLQACQNGNTVRAQ